MLFATHLLLGMLFFLMLRNFFSGGNEIIFFFFSISVYWNVYYATGLLLGYIAHLVGDSFSPSGIQMFYPFSQFKFKGPMKVGGFMEWVILVLLIVVIIWYIV